SESACAQRWGSALGAYAAAITPPSTTVTSAAQAVAGALAGFSDAGAAPAKLDSALTAFAASVGSGMTGTAAPPVSPGMASVLGSIYSTTDDAAGQIAQKIDTWMKTGTLTVGTVVTSWL